ncbi:MAG: biotin--[acetyl-CoA-carboxylase] ligase, partial [Ilumatobacteraceae bacterium]
MTHVAETGSTNDDLLALASRGAARDRSVLVADHQTAGRGRLDRRWDAPAGQNLLCSMLIDARNRPHVAQHIVALALIDAARETAGIELALKWPNDVVRVAADGAWAKVAGMLSVLVPDVGVIVGIGVNLGWAPEGGARIAAVDGRSSPTPSSTRRRSP